MSGLQRWAPSVTRQGPAWSRSALRQPECGALTSSRKDFTTQVQMGLRVMFSNAGDSEAKEEIRVGETAEGRLGGALL